MAKLRTGIKKLPNPDVFNRLNYLFHLANLVLINSFVVLKTGHPGMEFFTPSFVKANMAESIQLAQFYIRTLREAAKKAVIRL